MNSSNQNLSLGEAASRFLAKLPSEERGISQPEVYKFIRWNGWERPLVGLSPHQVASYAERLSLSDTDYLKKLELIKAFLVYAKKEGWTKTNLSTHLKAKKGKTPSKPSPGRASPEAVSLTREGYAELEAELNALKSKRPQIIEEISKAAADKDFRENAPLAAAREQAGHIEGRIKELEEALKSASIVEEKQKAAIKVGIGDSVVLSDLDSGEELRYTLVGTREAAPGKGKISTVSPVGKAVTGRREGDVVEVTTPVGKLRYQIKQVER